MFQVVDVLQSMEFLHFCERMKQELSNQSSPLDASLESILPGVHDRLDAQRKATIDLEHRLTEMGHRVKDSIIENSKQNFHHIASIFSEINSIIQTRQGQLASASTHGEPDAESTEAVNDDVEPTIQEASQDFLIQQRYESLMHLHNHWFGLAEFNCSHGISIDELERRHRNKWRKKLYTSAHETQFSRAKRIMTAMKAEAEKQKIPVHEIASMWSENFESDGRLKLPNVIKWLVENGHIAKKKQRGCSKSD